MEPRAYAGNKKVIGKYVPIVTKKKFTAPAFVDRNQQRNYRQFNQEDHSVGAKKPFRMNSVNKPTRGSSNQMGYAISGVNYLKKREQDHYEHELEESKSIPKHQINYVGRVSNPVQYLQKEWAQSRATPDLDHEEQIRALAQRVEELEITVKTKDIEISRIKMHNSRLASEKNMIEAKLKKMIREDKQKELERLERHQREEDEEAEADQEDLEGDQEELMDNNTLQKHLLSMLMQAQAYDNRMQEDYEAQREQEMLDKAIQESLKENPNPDVMNYEQLQELEEKMGFVSRGFTDREISMIPSKMSTSTKEDCSICLEQIKVSELVKTLSCGHDFHKDCINQCLKSTKKCPCCMHEHELTSV